MKPQMDSQSPDKPQLSYEQSVEQIRKDIDRISILNTKLEQEGDSEMSLRIRAVLQQFRELLEQISTYYVAEQHQKAWTDIRSRLDFFETGIDRLLQDPEKLREAQALRTKIDKLAEYRWQYASEVSAPTFIELQEILFDELPGKSRLIDAYRKMAGGEAPMVEAEIPQIRSGEIMNLAEEVVAQNPGKEPDAGLGVLLHGEPGDLVTKKLDEKIETVKEDWEQKVDALNKFVDEDVLQATKSLEQIVKLGDIRNLARATEDCLSESRVWLDTVRDIYDFTQRQLDSFSEYG